MGSPVQPRHPAGVPAGGQFAPGSQERSSIVLIDEADDGALHIDMSSATSDEDYNRTGTYAHPPIPRNAKQVIKFWLTAQIPDRVLDQVSAAYDARTAQLRAPAERTGLLRKAAPNPADGVNPQRPEQLAPYYLADVVRLGCMYRQAAALESDEATRLAGADFTLNNGAIAMSPRDAWYFYDLASIEGAFDDTHDRDVEARRDLQAYNLHADLISIGNRLAEPGAERTDTSWVPYGGVVQ